MRFRRTGDGSNPPGAAPFHLQPIRALFEAHQKGPQRRPAKKAPQGTVRSGKEDPGFWFSKLNLTQSAPRAAEWICTSSKSPRYS